MRLPVATYDSIDISVRNPIKVVCEEKYTTYEISVKTANIAFALPNSVTRRRFSEFCWLRKTLKNHHPQIKPPELPGKTLFSERFDPEFVSVRMKSLEEFLTRCFEERLYFSDSSLHLFIQSDLSCSHIEDYLHGQLTQQEMETSRDRCKSVKHTCSEDMSEGLSEDTNSCNAEVIVHSTGVTCDRQSSLPLRVTPTDLEDAASCSSGNISDSLESDMFVSCAVGPGNIQ